MKMLVAGETLNIFLLTGISNLNNFFIEKKNNAVVNSNKIMNYNINYAKKLIKNQRNRFPFERAKDVCPLPRAGQNNPLPLLLPQHIQIEDDLLNGGPCPTWRSGKNCSCGEACHTQAYVSVDAVVGVELLATTLAGKHMAIVLPNFVLARHLQRLENLSQILQR